MKAPRLLTSILLCLVVLSPAVGASAQQPGDQDGEPIWRRTTLAVLGGGILGGAAGIAANEQSGSLCGSKACIVSTASFIGAAVGFFIGRELDRNAHRVSIEGPTVDFGLRSVSLGDTPTGMTAHGGSIVALTREGVGVVDPDLRFRPLLSDVVPRAATVLPNSDYLLVASNTALMGLALSMAEPSPDVLSEGGGTALAAVADDAVAVGEPGRIRRLRISGNGSPARETRNVSTGGLTLGMSVAEGGGVLWTVGDSALVARDPGTLRELGRLGLPGRARDLTVSDRSGVVSMGPDGAVLVNLTNPASPSVVSMLQGPEFAYSGAILDGRAYVAAGPQGVFVYDVSRPSEPRNLGVARSVGFAGNLLVHQGRLYILDRERNELHRAEGLR